MGEIVAWVNRPCVAHPVVVHSLDAIHDRVAHVHVWMCHIDLGAEHLCAVFKFARAHLFKQIKTFGCWAVAVGAVFARLIDRATVCAHFVKAQLVYIGIARHDELTSPVKKLAEIVTGKADFRPFVTQPFNIL